jgi:predicted kinase
LYGSVLMIIIICGLPGVGKTAIAKDLAALINGAVVLSTDKIRKELISKPTYEKQERQLIYDVMLLFAKYLHIAGIDCILDATFNRESSRKEVKERLSLRHDQLFIVECMCPEEIIIRRLKNRQNGYSDADISIYRKMKRIYEPVKGDRHIVVDTSIQSSKEIAKAIAPKVLSSKSTITTIKANNDKRT